MRCRTSGSSAKRTISWMSRLPVSSAGCALPAMTSWMGRSGSSSSFLRRAGSRSISVRRLYVGTRRAKPMVSTSGVERAVDPRGLGGCVAPLDRRAAHPVAGVVDEAGAQGALEVPDLAVAELVDERPQGVGVVAVDVATAARGELDDLASDPGRAVDAVGDRRDRHLGLVERRPEAVEHAARHVAVQLGDAVGALGEAEAHHRHVEDAGLAAVVVLGAEREDPVDRDARRRRVAAEVLRRRARAGTGRCPRAPACAW